MPFPAFITLLIFGLTCATRAIVVENGAALVFSLVFIALVVWSGDRETFRRNRRASADLSALGRDQERLAFEDYYPSRRRAS